MPVKVGYRDRSDDTLIATLYIEDPKLYPAPHRANVAHSMTLTEALLQLAAKR